MALSKKSITGLGTLMSCAVIAISGFLVVKPGYDQSQTNKIELSSLQQETELKNDRLALLEEGVENYDEIQAYVDRFLQIAPGSKDVESASRAISNALVPGTTISSFTFGSPEASTEYAVPEASLSSENTIEFSVESSEGGDTAASPGSLQRVPVEISVTSSDYANLSEYLDNLAQQDRLLTVVNVSSSGTSGGDGEGLVSATIRGYAFIYAR